MNWFSLLRSMTGRKPPDFLGTVNRCEKKPGVSGGARSRAHFSSSAETSAKRTDLLSGSLGRWTGRGEQVRGGGRMNGSDRPWSRSFRCQRESSRTCQFSQKRESLPPTGVESVGGRPMPFTASSEPSRRGEKAVGDPGWRKTWTDAEPGPVEEAAAKSEPPAGRTAQRCGAGPVEVRTS